MKKNWIILTVALGALVLGAGLAAQAQEQAQEQEKAEKPADVAGKWEIKTETPRGERTITLNFEQEGSKLKGTMSGGFGGRRGGRQGGQRQGGGAALTGTVEGKKVTFSVTRQTPRGDFTTEYTGTVDGDTIKGKMETRRGERDFTATRVK